MSLIIKILIVLGMNIQFMLLHKLHYIVLFCLLFCVYVFVLFPPFASAYFLIGLWAAE
jgi:hypothetical protein